FIVYGQFYGGTKLTYRGSLSYRVQPWGNFTLGLEQNNIWLPEPYGNVDFTLATARVEINFATNLFWTTFLQYNTQADNFNINSRFQWRFAPMSDLFIVYTDNYLVEGMFGPKNRSLVLKCNYWLTL
ncbi:MAG: hydrolase, partial [Bacteroidota bacterium]